MARRITNKFDRAAVTTTTATRISRQLKQTSKRPRLLVTQPCSTLAIASPTSSRLRTKHHLSHLSLFSDIRIPSNLSSAIPLGLGSITFLSALQDYHEVVLSDYWDQGAVNIHSLPEVEASRSRDETCASVPLYHLIFSLCTVPKKGRISAGVTHLFLCLR